MGLALYRKYRPKKLEDVVGQEHITTSLQNALKSGAISHAYLFTGPRGVGKTSIARIWAHEINNLPYTEDSQHLDIIEIDAASNRRIDEIRDLRDKVHIAPSSAKYKVYIIDEVHMLTREAFNALLKTLEEPPEHAVFILATTESHKVPDTITSRTQRFIFKPITAADAAMHLKQLAKKEHIAITSDAIDLLASHGSGSFRDSINLLDQLADANAEVTVTSVERMLGVPNVQIVTDLLKSIHRKDLKSLSMLLAQAQTDGLHAAKLAKQLATSIREQFLSQPELQYKQTAHLLKELALVAGSNDSFAELELALFDYAVETRSVPTAALSTPTEIVAPPKATKQTAQPVEVVPKASIPSQPTAIISEIVHEEPIEPAALLPSTPDAFWNDYLHAIKQRKNTLYGVLRMATPQLVDQQLTLVFSFGFHQKQVSQAANLSLLGDVASELLGKNIQITALLQKGAPVPSLAPLKHSHETPKQAQASPLNDVASIFNGAELVE